MLFEELGLTNSSTLSNIYTADTTEFSIRVMLTKYILLIKYLD